MAIVISSNSNHSHVINKYNFKVLSRDLNESQASEHKFVKGSGQESKVEATDENLNVTAEITDENSLSKSSKDTLIESLLQKTDEMSSNFIKMQMKLESKDEEYQKNIEEAKVKAFEEGKLEGIKESQANASEEHASLMKQFSASVNTLESSTKEFSTSIEGIKIELINAAIDIAKEVILVELSEHSKEIASSLAQDLIKQIQSSSAVTLKVNAIDKVALEETLGTLENVKIISDNAVSKGGVVVLSDAGNIDGDIMKRFERVKDAALGK